MLKKSKKKHLLKVRQEPSTTPEVVKRKIISVCSGLVAPSKRTDLPLRTHFQLDETCRENQRKGLS